MAFAALCLLPASAAPSTPPDYSSVSAIFNQHCLDCHAATEPEGQLVLEHFETLAKGGELGSAFVPGKSADSLLVQMIEGRFEKEGKKKIMPPGKRKKLTPEEIATIRAWIDAGARGPSVEVAPKELVVPKILPRVPPRNPVNALAFSSAAKLVAAARYGEVELRAPAGLALARTFAGHIGNVNALAFSADGAQLFAAGGQPGLIGEVRQWHVADGKLVRVLEGHKDALYSLALSPDGKTLATGSYDQKIKLWDVANGKEIRTLSGHNGCVTDLAFRPDGKLLASASADRTVKLWDVASGERRETFSQSLKELYAVAFSPDGKRLLAGGADNRVRVWQISESGAETTNPLLQSKFAHEGAILNLVFSGDGRTLLSSADDRTVKLWDAGEMKERLVLEKQPDWAPALAFIADGTVIVGRLDGSIASYDVATGKLMTALSESPSPSWALRQPLKTLLRHPNLHRVLTAKKAAKMPPKPKVPKGKPEIFELEPRGIQNGTSARIKLTGTNLMAVKVVKLSNPGLNGALLETPPATTNELWVEITAAPNLARGPYQISVGTTNSESSKLGLYVDDLPQVTEADLKKSNPKPALKLPVDFWGSLSTPGDTDEVEFEANAGDSVILDLAAKSIGSKADAMLTLFDEQGALVASNNGLDGGDPLLDFRPSVTGRYRVRIGDRTDAGSKDHFYRLSIGTFPVVIGCFPLGVPANRETDLELLGFNLPARSTARVKAGAPGEMDVPMDLKNFRARRALKVIVNAGLELVETEPNDTTEQAMKIPVPAVVNGRISSRTDLDLFRFDARTAQPLIIETDAARRGSPIDTKIEVLHSDGTPVERLVLQAVRDSHLTFRPIDSNTDDLRVENWQEMELNQFMYLQGEVCKIFRMPQGPDSGFQFYNIGGKRRDYFDTSPIAHPLDEATYIVEPHPPGTKLVPNGLPVLPVYYASDDDGERKLGADSRLLFTAPADGGYLVRVTDTRGHGGERFSYRLIIREAKPDFKVSLAGANPVVNAGGGKEFSVTVDRIDGFDADVRVDITGLPPGFGVSAPVVIQAGHLEAKAAIHAALDASMPGTNAPMTKVTATAMIGGQTVTREVNNLGKIKLAEKPKLFVAIEPYDESATNFVERSITDPPLEFTIAPGQSLPAWLKIKRNGFNELVTFTVESLPHGVIVDNIGLNGVLIPKDKSERQIFLTAAKWVPETDRLCFAKAAQAEIQTSLPLLIHVRKPSAQASAAPGL